VATPKNIPFDSLNLYAVLTECQPLVGGRIQDIRQPEPLTVVLEVYAQRREHYLLISADAQFARLHRVSKRPPNAPTPPPFLQSLRKHIEGGTLTQIEQIGFDRIVSLHVRTREGEYRLMVELMGKHSNIILVNPSGLIQSAIKWVSPKQSAVRPIRSAERYQLPPTRVEGLRNPLTLSDAEWRALWEQAEGDWQAYLEGLSGFTAQELNAVAEGGFESLLAWVERLRHARWEPVVIRDPNTHRAIGAYPFPTLQFPPAWQHPRQSLNSAWETVFDERIRHARMDALRNTLLPALRKALQARQRALEEIERALEEGLHADRWQLFGELILAFGHTLEPGATKLLAPDYTHPDMPTIEIPIDPTRSVVENAERYFQKARRAREHQNELAQRYGILSEEAEALRLALERTENAHTETDLRPILEEARARGWLRETAPLHPAKRAEKDPFEGHRIRVHLSPDGYQVLVGENAEANDYLLTRVARPNDWWLHVRAGTGAHVIIRTNNQPERVPRRTLEFAAKLAAQNSADRHAHIVEVDYTLRKYVRKPKGAPSGFALYTHEKTLAVRPNAP
jgi:predicted ribosome quality control (RQC) complex YloA/Tae2 family protein